MARMPVLFHSRLEYFTIAPLELTSVIVGAAWPSISGNVLDLEIKSTEALTGPTCSKHPVGQGQSLALS